MLGAARTRTPPVVEAFGRVAARLGLSPNAVTLASLVFAAGGAAALALRAYLWGAALMLVAAVLDFTDGALARSTGRATLVGGYLDSLVDRYVDALLLLGILLGLDHPWAWPVGLAALFGSVATSFAKARVYQDLRPDPSVWRRDLMERPERYFLLVPAVIAQGVLARTGSGFPLLFWALVLLAVLSNLTVLQRMRAGLRVLRDADGNRS